MEKSESNRELASRLLNWFAINRRAFPWREHFEEQDPYRILFAEVMLQRTQANQAGVVYSEFLNKYPTFTALKAANSREVRRLLKPLGLRHRVERIIQLVDYLDTQLDGHIPHDYEGLLKLPSVGPYMASAVMCYAYGEPIVAVDVNVIRILSRLFGLPYTMNSKGNRSLKELADSLIPVGRAKDFNLCLLDFGALVCTAKNPHCHECPINSFCQYYKRTTS